MADVASRPRTTDFAFMRRFADDLNSRSTERPATAADFAPLGDGSASLYTDQELNTSNSLGEAELSCDVDGKTFIERGKGDEISSGQTPAAATGEGGSIPTDFHFPDMPPALLEQPPEYEYSAHTRINVFAEALQGDYPALNFHEDSRQVQGLPSDSAQYSDSWSQAGSVPVSGDAYTQTVPYSRPAQSDTSSSSLLYGEETSAPLQDASSTHHDYAELYHDPVPAFDVNHATQAKYTPASSLLHNYDGFYNGMPKTLSEGSQHQPSAGSHGNTLSPAQSLRSHPSVLHHLNYSNPSMTSMNESQHPSPSTSRGYASTSYGETSVPKRLRAASPSAYAEVVPQFSSPSTRHSYPSPVHSIQFPAPAGEPNQSLVYNLPPSSSRYGSQSSNPSRTASVSAQPGFFPTRYDGSLPAANLLEDTHAHGVSSFPTQEWPELRRGFNSSTSHYLPESGIGQPISSRSNLNVLPTVSIVPANALATDTRAYSRSTSREGPGPTSTTSQRRRKSSNGGGGGSTDDELEDLQDAPPPDPRTVALAEAATTRQSGTQAQQEALQALNEELDKTLQRAGVARCPFPRCTKTFAKNRSYNLKTHLRSHSQLKPFACVSCPRAFSRKHDLERHSRVHSGDRPYLCEVCGRGFPRSDALRRHWKIEKECGDKAFESDPPGGSSATSSVSAQTSSMTALAPLSFMDRSGYGSAGSDRGVRPSPDGSLHNPGSAYLYGQEATSSRFSGPPAQPLASSSTLLANGKRVREEW